MRLRGGFAYLVALLDWFSRYVLAWEFSPSLETLPCVRGLAAGVAGEIVNSDQGCQFTSGEMDRGGAGRRQPGQSRRARAGLGRYFGFSNTERPHQGRACRTPLEVLKGTL